VTGTVHREIAVRQEAAVLLAAERSASALTLGLDETTAITTETSRLRAGAMTRHASARGTAAGRQVQDGMVLAEAQVAEMDAAPMQDILSGSGSDRAAQVHGDATTTMTLPVHEIDITTGIVTVIATGKGHGTTSAVGSTAPRGHRLLPDLEASGRSGIRALFRAMSA